MPEISRFLGIVICMYFNDHAPPHFHVQYNEYRATIDIEHLGIMEGSLPARIHGLVAEWGELHRSELLHNWDQLRKEGTFNKIRPLV